MVQSARTITFHVEKLRDIPTLSIVVTKLMDMVNDPNTSANQIAEVLKKDQVLTAKVLRLVNSAFYNLSTEVTDVTKALGFLGFNTISVLVLGTSVFSSFDLKAAPYFKVSEFWKHSLCTAVAGELIATRLKVSRPQDAFTCGLLHDVGKIALFKVAQDDLKEVVELARNENISFLEAETALGLPGHTVIGERLAEQWKLPVVIRKTIRFHHRDVTEMESIYPQMKPTIMIATIADIMSKRLSLGFSGDETKPEYPANYLQQLNISTDLLTSIEAKMPEEMERVGAFLAATRV
ncbi:HDOD domain-containing protein [bacterium]|nr:HDOD domain-containing protein [bacterium]